LKLLEKKSKMANFGCAIFGTWRTVLMKVWFPAILCYGCHALSSSSSSIPSSSLSYPSSSSSSSSMVYLAKTKETFKLSELQYLAAGIEAHQRPQRYNLTRLVVDPATGSSIFQLDVAMTTMTTMEAAWPFSWRRCEWIAEVLGEGDSAAQLLEHIMERQQQQHYPVTPIAKGWSLEYLAITKRARGTEASVPLQDYRKKQRRLVPFTSKTLLYSIAHVLPTAPALNPVEATDRLVVLELQGVGAASADDAGAGAAAITTCNTEQKDDSDPCGSAFYLTRVVDLQTPLRSTRTLAYSSSSSSSSLTMQSSIEDQWSSRPFQYSSAMNIDVAKIVVETLMDMVVHRKMEASWTNHQDNHPKDSGSGSSSSSSSSTHNSTEERPLRILDPTCGSGSFLAIALELGMQVEGFDINLNCVHGTLQNLQHVFGMEHVYGHARIQQLDSSLWGTTDDDDDNDHIASPSSQNDSRSSSTRILQKEWDAIKDIDCVVANLPWGVNTIQYQDENSRILRAVRNCLEFGSSRRDNRGAGIPCAFVTKESDSYLFEAAGYEVLGEAHVPPRDFDLPGGKKTTKRLSERGRPTTRDDANPRNYRNNCVVTFVRTK
jgi:hypothetical protein